MQTAKKIFNVALSMLLVQVTHFEKMFAQNNLSPGLGLKELTPEENQKLNKKKIKKVRPNRMGLDRINSDRAHKGLEPLPDSELSQNELEYDTDPSLAAATGTGSTGVTTSEVVNLALPAGVDNSQLLAFPKIGNQSAQGSCVAWATTYYLMSHEVCLTLGCDNKNANAKVFSPRWTYNMINGGVDGGSYFSDAFNLISKNGAASMAELPYTYTDYKGWDLVAEHWKTAINSRMPAVSTMSINSDSAFANVKQMLVNGHVMVIGTYITSWQFSTVKDDPNSTAVDLFTGQSVVTYLNGSSGGHAMTVVGYDDSIWTDINSNGIVESAELGAFKIANSWGAGWKNAGYSWAAYDAFRSVSAVASFAPAGRRELTQSGYAYTSTYVPYAPKLLAKVTASHLSRNQINFQFATSSASALTPQSYWATSAFTNDGGAFAFNGSTVEVEASFYFDLSQLLTTSVDQQLFYLIAGDNTAGNALTLRAFELIDPLVGNTLYAAYGVPALVDAKTSQFIAGNYTPDTQAPTAPTNLKAVLSQVRKGKTIKTVVNLSWSAATDNVGVTAYKIYRNGVLYASVANLSYADTSTSAGVSYNYQVKATDAAGNDSQASTTVNVTR